MWQYVLIGGYAAQLRGATRPTTDIDVTPATTPENLDDLSESAERRLVAGIEIQLASLLDIIRSKEAAGREKDFAALPELHRLARHPPQE